MEHTEDQNERFDFDSWGAILVSLLIESPTAPRNETAVRIYNMLSEEGKVLFPSLLGMRHVIEHLDNFPFLEAIPSVSFAIEVVHYQVNWKKLITSEGAKAYIRKQLQHQRQVLTSFEAEVRSARKMVSYWEHMLVASEAAISPTETTNE